MRKLIAKRAPYYCGFCNEYAICGLKSRSNPGLVVNVCRIHFIEKMGREPKPEEIKSPSLPMEGR